jgi:cephalosporin hydroxylase
MCAAANTYGGQVIGIDLNTHDLTSRILPDKYDYYFIHGDSTSKETSSVVKGLLNDGKTSKHLGLVFQDSSHHYRASCEEWEIYSGLLAPNAIWICDDITPDFYNPEVDPPDKGMVQYFEERPGKKIYTDRLHKGNTMGIIFNVKQENNIR